MKYLQDLFELYFGKDHDYDLESIIEVQRDIITAANCVKQPNLFKKKTVAGDFTSYKVLMKAISFKKFCKLSVF